MSEQNKQETVFSKGIFFQKPKEGSPAWVYGRVSIHIDDFNAWAEQYVDEERKIKLDICFPRDATKQIYCKLNTYVPKKKEENNQSGFAL